MQKKVLEVYQINQYIKHLIEEDIILHQVFVQGEISNLKYQNHAYFTLKDDHSAISCVMFASHARQQKQKLENGMKVMLFGRVGVYEKTGQYQLYVELVQPQGRGVMHLAFEQLKQKLDDEGLFDAEHKKPLPPNPQRIGLVTSATGAVVQDMIRVAKRRNPAVELVVVPTLVQGDSAPHAIADALYDLAIYGKVDMAILARGGGSREDLWAFNEEVVARAVFHFPLPLISAVGHETDVSITDFVADVRASTPSMAMEMALPDMLEQTRALHNHLRLLHGFMGGMLAQHKHQLSQLTHSPALRDFPQLVSQQTEQLQQLDTRLAQLVSQRLDHQKQRFTHLVALLESHSPLAIMARGYSTTYANGTLVKSVSTVTPTDILDIHLTDGVIHARVETVSQRTITP